MCIFSGEDGQRCATLMVTGELLRHNGIVDFAGLELSQDARDSARSALSLPSDCVLLSARKSSDERDMIFRAKHPHFPANRRGFGLPTASAIFRTENGEAVFIEWELH